MDHHQRLFVERSLSAERSKRCQPPADHDEWTAAGFTARILCHYNKIFVVWKRTESGPKILGRLRIVGMDLDVTEGLGLSIETTVRSKAEDIQWIGHTPTRLFDLPVFAHIPYLVDLSYLPRGDFADAPVLRVPIVIRTAGNPDYPVDGGVYVSQIAEFRATYPEFSDLRV
jgi:hypothetical protein